MEDTWRLFLKTDPGGQIGRQLDNRTGDTARDTVEDTVGDKVPRSTSPVERVPCGGK